MKELNKEFSKEFLNKLPKKLLQKPQSTRLEELQEEFLRKLRISSEVSDAIAEDVERGIPKALGLHRQMLLHGLKLANCWPFHKKKHEVCNNCRFTLPEKCL